MHMITSLFALFLTLAAPQAPERKSMEKFVGTWKGSGTMKAGGADHPVSGRWSCEQASAGYGLRCEIRLTGIPGMEEFVESHLIGYDGAEKQIHMATVCNAGEAHDLRGDWTEAGLSLKDSRERIDVKFAGANKMQVRVINEGGGPVFNMTFSK